MNAAIVIGVILPIVIPVAVVIILIKTWDALMFSILEYGYQCYTWCWINLYSSWLRNTFLFFFCSTVLIIYTAFWLHVYDTRLCSNLTFWSAICTFISATWSDMEYSDIRINNLYMYIISAIRYNDDIWWADIISDVCLLLQWSPEVSREVQTETETEGRKEIPN